MRRTTSGISDSLIVLPEPITGRTRARVLSRPPPSAQPLELEPWSLEGEWISGAEAMAAELADVDQVNELVPAEQLVAELRTSGASPFVLAVASRLAARTLRSDARRTWLHVAAEAAQAEGCWLGSVLALERGPSEVSHARHAAWAGLVDEASYTVQAEVWGRRNHTTLIDGVQAHLTRAARRTARVA